MKYRWQEDYQNVLEVSVDYLGISVRISNCFKNNNIETIGDLIQKTERQLLQMPNFGQNSLDELKEALLEDIGINWDLRAGYVTKEAEENIKLKEKIKEMEHIIDLAKRSNDAWKEEVDRLSAYDQETLVDRFAAAALPSVILHYQGDAEAHAAIAYRYGHAMMYSRKVQRKKAF